MLDRNILLSALLLGPPSVALCQAEPPSSGWFAIRVVDAGTGRGVPLVELKTVNHLRYYTDSNGWVAFREPGLMNRQIFFHVRSHGYEYPKDGFGYRGKRLSTAPGTEAVLKLKRLNIAERLYRVTGGGIYRDSHLLGRDAPIEQPLLNGAVFGSDSVVTAIYRDKLHWFWGDTNRPSYPLGNFHVPFATSQLPGEGGLDPALGVNLTYAVGENGFVKEAARMPGKGPTWIDGLVVLPDESKQPQLLAQYVKVRAPLEIYERGVVQFDDERQQFEHRVTFPKDARCTRMGTRSGIAPRTDTSTFTLPAACRWCASARRSTVISIPPNTRRTPSCNPVSEMRCSATRTAVSLTSSWASGRPTTRILDVLAASFPTYSTSRTNFR